MNWRERREEAGVEWPDFGIAETAQQRRERERSIRDAAAYVADGRHVDVQLESEWIEHPVTGEPLEVLGWRYAESGDDVPWCGEAIRRRGTPGSGGWLEYCERPAGWRTEHPGAGPCRNHERRVGAGTGAWIVAHAFARALEVTPWEGLLWAVRIAAGRVAWLEAKLGTAEDDAELEPNGRLHHWVRESREERDRLARVSKLAIDAGVAERLVRQLELEATLMLQATRLTFDELGLDDDVRERALGIMSRNLLALEAGQTETSEE